MADKQPPNNQAVRKLPIPPLSTTVYMTNKSKQEKTNVEKRAKKKELGRVTLQGGALEASWSAAEREGGTWKLYLEVYCCTETVY